MFKSSRYNLLICQKGIVVSKCPKTNERRDDSFLKTILDEQTMDKQIHNPPIT